MPLEIIAVVLSGVAVVVVAMMLMLALDGIADPAVYTRCHECRRWTINTLHRDDATCVRCRHHHHEPVAG